MTYRPNEDENPAVNPRYTSLNILNLVFHTLKPGFHCRMQTFKPLN